MIRAGVKELTHAAARGPVILTRQSATASLTPAYPPPLPPAGCCAGLQIALKVNRARVVFVHLAQQLLHVLLPRGVERAASWAEAGGAHAGERGYRALQLAAGWRWPPPGVAAKRLKEPATDGCLCSALPAARATLGTGHGTACRDHPSMPGSGRGQPDCATLFHTRHGTFLGSQPSARMTTQRSSVSIVPVPSLSNRSNESWISLSWSSFSSFFLR